ncbi:MAG: hypothetical protein RLZZ455_187 [Candidatus Parcubacteria bacterium]|jgi:hypothetical protein
MKIQDGIFIVIIIFFLLRRDGRHASLAGLLCLFVAVPLFQFWIFFTAERLTWYAASFFLLSALLPQQLRTKK